MLRNIPYTIRNSRDLVSQLPKTVYCGLETITLAATTGNNKKSSSLVSFKQNIKLWKDPKSSSRVCKTYIRGLGFI